MLLQQWHRKLLKGESSCPWISWLLVPIAIARSTYFTHIYWISVCVRQNTTNKTSTSNPNIQIPFWLGFHFAPSPPPGCFLPCMPEITTIFLNPVSQRLETCSSSLWNILPLRPNVTSSERPSLTTIQYRVPCHFWIPTLLFFFCIALITIRFVQCLLCSTHIPSYLEQPQAHNRWSINVEHL